MLGKDLYKIDVKAELSSEALKSLVFFYGPLIGHDALVLYQYLVLQETSVGVEPLNNLLMSLNINVDIFEDQIKKLNQYRLVKTLQKEDRYVFIFENPLSRKEFVKDDIFVRDFIKKTSGLHFKELSASIREDNNYSDYEDVSETLSLDVIRNWTKEDETYLKPNKNKNLYDFNTVFDMNYFLKDISDNLFPFKLRTKNELYEMAKLADLYSVSYDKMRTYLCKVANKDMDKIDIEKLRELCKKSRADYIESEDSYHMSCIHFLMKLQDGKEVTYSDKELLQVLSDKYHLNAEVINVLIEYSLKKLDNRLIDKYVYKIASDLHRNNINSAEKAIEYLNGKKKSEDRTVPKYDTSKNKELSQEELEELLSLRGK